MQLRWVWGASEQEAGAHVTCRLAYSNMELIRRLFSIYSTLRGGMWRWSVSFFVASL